MGDTGAVVPNLTKWCEPAILQMVPVPVPNDALPTESVGHQFEVACLGAATPVPVYRTSHVLAELLLFST